jgi:signal transduction histidine kinase
MYINGGLMTIYKPVNFLSNIQKKPFQLELVYTVLFGGLSLLFGFLNQIDGGMSNFKEIPLLIHLFYLRNPFSIIFTSLITSIPLTHETSFINNFLIHFPALIAGWLSYRYLIEKINGYLVKGVLWMIVTAIYYVLLIVPIWALVSHSDMGTTYTDAYLKGLASVEFEMFATMFVTSLYLAQRTIRKSLEEHKNDLEHTVRQRTEQLADANDNLRMSNEELLTNSEEITSLNENLDELVKIRSKKIQEQIEVLVKYADMNSHQVRAPLARLLGLIYLIEEEKEEENKREYYRMLKSCAEELDEMIKSMNRLLEKGISPK